MQLIGKALQWHHGYILNHYNIYPLWPDYDTAISSRFGKLFYDPLSELVSLKQEVTLSMYTWKRLIARLNRFQLPPGHALSIFLTNMNQHLALHVRQFNVTTVPEAARIAKLQEISLHHTPIKTSRFSFNYSHKQNSPQSYKTQKTNTAPTQNTTPLLAITPHKRLTFKEMQERKWKELCMFCEEPFTPGH